MGYFPRPGCTWENKNGDKGSAKVDNCRTNVLSQRVLERDKKVYSWLPVNSTHVYAEISATSPQEMEKWEGGEGPGRG